MTLAQVVYHMSTDRDFASQLFSNPDNTLEKRGFKISKEELAFLLTAHRRTEVEKTNIVSLASTAEARWY
jgi:hypothetical protein